MRYTTALLPLVAMSSAFVIPDEVMTAQIMDSETTAQPQTFFDRLRQSADIDSVWSGVEETFKNAKVLGSNAIDAAFNAGQEVKAAFECTHSMTKFDVSGWLESFIPPSTDVNLAEEDEGHPPHRRHGHHHKPNQTIYEMISSSNYTTKLVSLINEYPDLVEILNGTAANYTLFAPTDKAFEKLPKHKKPSKELIKKVLAYHLSADFYPAKRVLVTHTIPSVLGEDALGGSQRLRVGLSLAKGLNINFYSRIVAVNIFATNGVIHGVDSLLLPPPPALKIVELFPGEFSTLQLGLLKTGLFDAIKDSEHVGGTLFAPSNFAFQKLGPRINAFLFSKYGEKYLKALLQYHVVANQTLYSDAYYGPKSQEGEEKEMYIPKGKFHIDLPTLLEDKSLSIDVARFGGLITIRINGFASVAVQDGIAKDGVIHVVGSVLIPPKTPGGKQEEMAYDDVEDFKERLISEGREDL